MDIDQYKNPDGKDLAFPSAEQFKNEPWVRFDVSSPDDHEKAALLIATGIDIPWRALYVRLPQVWDSVTNELKRGHACGFAIPASDDLDPVVLPKSFNLFMKNNNDEIVFLYGLYFVLITKSVSLPWKTGFPSDHIHRPMELSHEPDFLVFDLNDDYRFRIHISKNIATPLPVYELGYAVIYNPNKLASHRYCPWTRTSVGVKVYVVGRELMFPPIEIPGALDLPVDIAEKGMTLYHGMMKRYIKHFENDFAKDLEITQPVERGEDVFSRAFENFWSIEKLKFSCISPEQLAEVVEQFDQKGNSESKTKISERLEDLMIGHREQIYLQSIYCSDATKIGLKNNFVQFAARVQTEDVDWIARHLHLETNCAFHRNPAELMGNQ